MNNSKSKIYQTSENKRKFHLTATSSSVFDQTLALKPFPVSPKPRNIMTISFVTDWNTSRGAFEQQNLVSEMNYHLLSQK